MQDQVDALAELGVRAAFHIKRIPVGT